MSILKLSVNAHCACGSSVPLTMTTWFSNWEPHRTREECKAQAERNLTKLAAQPSSLANVPVCENCGGLNERILGVNRFEEVEDKEDSNN